MKAKIAPSYDVNREPLRNIIPLNTPFTIFIEPTRLCNFKCFYCLHSTRGIVGGELDKTGYKLKNMEMELYEKILRDMQKFPQKPKRIVYSGLGEPLINNNLPEMIKMAKAMKIAERLDVLTNASLLTEKLTDDLISSGVTRIQISLQGLSSQKYKDVSNIDLDYHKFIENIKYLYNNRKQCKVFIKIIDALLENDEDKDGFFKVFGEMSDQIYIEHLITLQHQMGNHNGKADDSKNLNNEPVIYRNVCPVIFYMLQIDVDGNVFPCPVSGLPKYFSIDNIKLQDLNEIWKGETRRAFLLNHLKLHRDRIPVCNSCNACSCVLDKNEYLDDYAEEIKKRIIIEENE